MKKEKNEKTFIALTSVLAAIFLTGFKLVIGLATGSLGILSEAAHSGLDLIAAVITLIAVKMSDRPADKDHHFGHGKIENFSALVETILLLITCIWIIFEAYQRLFVKTVLVDVNVLSFVVVLTSIIIDISRSRALYRVAIKYDSQALKADALHFQTDIWSSSVVLIGLIFALFNFHQADSIAALMVAAIVIWISYKLGKQTIDALLDKVPEGLEEKVKLHILKLPEVETIRVLRIRKSGPKVFVDVTLCLKRTLLFEQVHEVLDKIEKEIIKTVPNVDVIIHPEPIQSPEESLFDKIKFISARYGANVHAFEKHKLHNMKFSLDLHLEILPGTSFKEAHDLSTLVENAIYKEIPEIEKVIIHIEDSNPFPTEENDITEKSVELIEELTKVSLAEDGIKECFNFSVFEIKEKLKISMSCRVLNSLKLDEVHEIISGLEEKIKVKSKNIDKITIHAEPYEL